ncbi:plasmid pRiA4b ORF-3 family protein [Arthrobacter psychrolactophilus]
MFTLFYDDNDDDDEPGELELPQRPSAEEELAALSGTQLAVHLSALLQWIGESKPVTSTGALKLAEIEGAAAAVGLVAKGAARNAKRQHIPGFNTESLEPGAPLIVKTMHELPLLSKIWAAMEGGGFIDIGSTKVRPTPNAEAILVHEHPAHLAALRGLMANFLSVSVMGEQEWAPWVAPAAEAQAGLLYAAALEKSTIPVSLLENPDTLENLGMDEFAGRLLRRRMAELEELGVVTMDGAVRVQPALVPMVLLALGRHIGDGGGASPLLPGSVNAGPTPTHPVPLLQLKVAIEGTKPPVWRRLVLRSDLTLAQLHSIIQASFAWLDCHLHEFNVGGYNGITYGPIGPEHDFGDPMPEDEAAVTVGQLLKAEKDSISYTYDFGDDWRHRIVLEEILPFAPGAAVRCTGGRGMGPAEDCGGPWGWQNVVAAVNDPAHEEHTEYREWLGLGPDETLDPKEFDREALDEELTELF